MTTTEQAKQGGNWPHLMKNDKDCNGWYNALIFMECNTFRLEALLHAAGQVGARESRDTSERRLHIAAPGGTVTVREKQEGWYDVLEADLPEDDYEDFWEKLRSWTEGNPRMRRSSNRMPWEKNELEEEPDPQDDGKFDRGRMFQLGIAQVQVGRISRAASFLVNPEEPFESFQTSIHGINEEAVSEAETMLSIHPQLCRLIEGTPLASHSQFDKQALEKAASKYGLTMPEIRWLDTGRVARTAWPDRYDGSSWGLKKIAADLGIKFLHHDAAEDARTAAEILLHACRHTGLDVDDWLERARYERSLAAKTKTQQVQQTDHGSRISEGIPRQSDPPPWDRTLARILALEEEREFSNRSVTGGMDRFIQKHAKAITEELGDSGIHRILLRIPYRGLTQEERPWWVEQWRAVIVRMQQVSAPEPPQTNAAPPHRAPGLASPAS